MRADTDATERLRERRRLARRIRRHKRDLERRNPLDDPDYLRRFEALVALEAASRALADPPPPVE